MIRESRSAVSVRRGAGSGPTPSSCTLLLGLFTQMTEAAEPALNPAALLGDHVLALAEQSATREQLTHCRLTHGHALLESGQLDVAEALRAQ